MYNSVKCGLARKDAAKNIFIGLDKNYDDYSFDRKKHKNIAW